MGAKYGKRQKVRIISLKNEYLKAKHPHVEEYVSQTGVTTESHWYGINQSPHPLSEHPHVIGYYIYDVRLDRDREIIRAIPEDALEPVA